MIATSAVLATVVLATTTLAPTAGIVFSESYSAAFEEANERGVPIMITIIQDDEEANDDIWLNTMNAPEFLKATRGTVNIVGNRGDTDLHGFKEVEENGKRRRICGRFGSISCTSHKKNEVGIFRDFARDGVLRTPMVMLVLPDQTIVAQLIDRHPMVEFLGAFEKAKRKLPNGLQYDEAVTLKENLEEARGWIDAGEIQKVIKFAAPFQKRKTEAGLVKRALVLLDEVEEKGKGEMADAQSLIEAKDYANGMARYEALISSYRGSTIEKVAKERRAKLAKNRHVKAALAAAKKETTAKTLLERADDFESKGKGDRAAKLYQQIRERFAGTEAAKQLESREG